MTITVVFDGACNVCTGFVRFLERRGGGAAMTFVPAASDRGRALLAACGEAPDDPATMIVADGARMLTRSDAVLAAVAALGGGWRAVRPLAIVPRRWRDALYAGFAARRYRWFGRADCAACDAGRPLRR